MLKGVGICSKREHLLIEVPSPARKVIACKTREMPMTLFEPPTAASLWSQHQGEARWIAEGDDEHTVSISEAHAPGVRPDPSGPFPAQVGLLVEGMSPGWYIMQQNLTGAPLPQIRRRLSRAWRSMLASRIDEALDTVEQIERQLGDVPPADAPRFRAAIQLLRAAGLAFQDDSLGAAAIAGS